MAVFVVVCTAVTLTAPALGGVIPGPNVAMQKPVLASSAPSGASPTSSFFGTPPLGAAVPARAVEAYGARLRQQKRAEFEASWTPMSKLQKTSPAPTWGRPQLPAPYYIKKTEQCPGEDKKYRHGSKCVYDHTHRVCAKVLDDEGKPLVWAQDKTFWDLRYGWIYPEHIADNGGDSSCISMWVWASAVTRLGCDKVPIRCDATSLNYITKRFTVLRAFDKYTEGHPLGAIDQMATIKCLEDTCAAERWNPHGLFAPYFQKPEEVSPISAEASLASAPVDAVAWGTATLIGSIVLVAGAMGAAFAKAGSLSKALQWHTPEVSIEPMMLG